MFSLFIATIRLIQHHETFKQQTKIITSGADTEVQINRVRILIKDIVIKIKTKWKKCIRCGKFPVHNKNDCPAINEHNRQCSKIGNYASVCRNKSEVKELKDGSFLGSITLEKVN